MLTLIALQPESILTGRQPFRHGANDLRHVFEKASLERSHFARIHSIK